MQKSVFRNVLTTTLFFLLLLLCEAGRAQPVFASCQSLVQQLREAAASAQSAQALREVIELARTAQACFHEELPSASISSTTHDYAYFYEIRAMRALGYQMEVIARVDDLEKTHWETASPWLRMFVLGTRQVMAWQVGDPADRLRAMLKLTTLLDDLEPENQFYTLSNLAKSFGYLNDFVRASATLDRVDSLITHTPLAPATSDSLRSLLGTYRVHLLIKKAVLTGAPLDPATLPLAQETLRLALPLQAPYHLMSAYHLLAETYSLSGEHTQALRTMEQMYPLVPRTLPGFPQSELEVHHRHGRLLMRAGDPAEARRLLLQAYDAAVALRFSEHQHDLLSDLGYLFESTGRFDEAAGYYEQAIAFVERHRASLSGTDWASIAFGLWQQPYRGLARIRLHQGRVAEALEVFSRVKGRHLSEQRSLLEAYRSLAPSRQASYNRLERRLQVLRDSLRLPALSPRERERLQLAEPQVDLARNALLYEALPPRPSLDLLRLQEALALRQARMLVYFLDTEDFPVLPPPLARLRSSGVFVITPDTVWWQPLEVTEQRVQELLAQSGSLWQTNSESGDGQVNLTSLYELYQRLVAPVFPQFHPKQPLVIIPDGSLYLLPFSLLPVRPVGTFAFREADYLLYHHPISYELSPALYEEAAPAQASVELSAFGVARFESLPPVVSPLRAELAPLPSVPEEIRALRRHYPSAFTALNEAATDARVRQVAPASRILHFASHAILNPAHNQYSHIVLHPTDSTDGAFFLYQVADMALSTALVVLNGCNTARGPWRSGEGLLGMNYAFRASGVDATLANLWFVDDASASLLVQQFYRHLSKGHAKAEALRLAQQDYLGQCEAERCNPYYWASPMLYGSMVPLPPAPSLIHLGTWMLWLIVCTCVLLTFFLLRPLFRYAR